MKKNNRVPANNAGQRRATTPGTSQWHGAVEGILDQVLFGWAVNAQDPQARVIVEVCLNDEPLKASTADCARADKAQEMYQTLGPMEGLDCCHGFAVSLADIAGVESGVVSVRVANTKVLLNGTIDLAAPEKPPVSATSLVLGDGGLTLHGWVAQGHPSSQPAAVRAYVGNKLVAQTVANWVSPLTRLLGYAAQSFQLTLPLALANGQLHLVRVVDDLGQPLNGSPVTVCAYADGPLALLGDAPAILTSVLASYQTHVPRSIGKAYFREWSERFGNPTLPPAKQATKKPLPAVGMIISGEGSPQALARSVESLQKQTGVRAMYHVVDNGVKGEKLLHAALRKLLASPVQAVGFMRAGDTLPTNALQLAMQGFAEAGTHAVYTDSEFEARPWFKPAWSMEYALATDYPLELLLVRTPTLAANIEAEGLPVGVAALAWRLLARACLQSETAIVHIPHVLYQYHSPLSDHERSQRLQAARQALQTIEPTATLEPVGAQANHPLFSPRRYRRRLSSKHAKQLVSLVIPTRDHLDLLQRCIHSLQHYTNSVQLEIIVIDNGSVQSKTKTYFREITKQGVRVLPMPGPFNFAALNNRAIEAASGSIIGLINNDIEALHDGWLDEMLSHLMAPGVGAVGAKLLWPNAMVQHGGVLLGVGNVAGHYGNWLSDADAGDHARNQLVQRVSGVTAACLLVRKQDYQRVGGMNEHLFPVAFNDVDLCLRLRRLGKSIVWTPHAKLLHAESASRGSEDTAQKKARARREVNNLRTAWGAVLLNDPYYHPSLNLDALGQPFAALALPPRDRSPRTSALGA